jgi:hypothetical protein
MFILWSRKNKGKKFMSLNFLHLILYRKQEIYLFLVQKWKKKSQRIYLESFGWGYEMNELPKINLKEWVWPACQTYAS